MKKRPFLALIAVALACSLSSASSSFAKSSALSELLQESPTGKAPDVKAPAAAPTPAAAPLKVIAPGKDLSPKISDPARVQLILSIIEKVADGKPLPFPKDGVIFDNREGRLAAKPAGYYHEYTVLPPDGSPSTITVGGQTFQISPPQGHRGAERLIIGGGEILYYSPDHYTTFIQLQVIR